VPTDDLAVAIAKTATSPSEEIAHQTIDMDWCDGPKKPETDG
jgi:hypothetical protein